MLVIDNGDAIRGIAEVASKLDFIVNGYVGTTATQLADGQLASAEGDLYASSADATVVTSITIVNTDSAARTFTLYLKPSGGTSRAITPVSLDLGIGHSCYTDGQRVTVLDASGNVLTVLSMVLGNLSDVTLTSEADHDMLYYDNATSLWKNATPATILAQLSGQAGAAFDWNSQDLTSLGTLSGFTMGSTIVGNAQSITGLSTLSGRTTGTGLFIMSNRTSASPSGISFYTKNAAGADTVRFQIATGANACAINWASGVFHTAFALGGSLVLSGQTFDAGSGYAQVDTTGVVALNLAKSIQLTEMTAPGAGAANTARLYAHLVDGGKTELCVIFQSGAVQVLATEP